MIYEYKTISLRTLSGVKQAERMKANGWEIVSIGFETIMFQRPRPLLKALKYN